MISQAHKENKGNLLVNISNVDIFRTESLKGQINNQSQIM
jgi:hypothetical protein